MQRPLIAPIMSALSQPTRLKVVELLATKGRAGMGSSDMADEVGVPRNLMSSHLAILSRAGLLTSKKEGRSVVYALNETAVRHLVEQLGGLLAP